MYVEEEYQFSNIMNYTALSLLRGEQGLLRKIFEYDDTYKTKLQTLVVTSIWEEIWCRYLNEQECPYERAVIDYLLHVWGITGPEMYKNPFLRRRYFPDGFRIANKRQERDKMHLFAYIQNGTLTQVFQGMILTPAQHKEYCREERGNVEDYLDVHEDMTTGMVVYVKLFN